MKIVKQGRTLESISNIDALFSGLKARVPESHTPDVKACSDRFGLGAKGYRLARALWSAGG